MIDNVSMVFANSSQLIRNRVVETTFSVKEECFGIAGVPGIVIALLLILFNFVAFMYWKKFAYEQIELFGKKFYLGFFVPLINACASVFIALYMYNLF